MQVSKEGRKRRFRSSRDLCVRIRRARVSIEASMFVLGINFKTTKLDFVWRDVFS
jgi:hypothetical protein